jgi:hypothetical protein
MANFKSEEERKVRNSKWQIASQKRREKLGIASGKLHARRGEKS